MANNFEEAIIASFNADALPSVKGLRVDALEKLKTQGLPQLKAEEYKFTPVTKVLNKSFDGTALTAGTINSGQLEPQLLDKDADIQLFFVNGKYDDTLSVITNVPEGITIKKLSDSLDSDKTAKEHFGNYAKSGLDPFTSLNTAIAEDGIFIKADKNASLDAVYIYYVNDASSTESRSFPRNLVIAEQGSQVLFVEKTITLGNHNSFFNPLSEIIVKENADVKHIKLQNDSPISYEVSHTQVKQHNDSRYSSYVVTLDGGLIRNNMNIDSDGQNCESNMYGLYLIKGNSHVDNHTTVDHIQPNSFSNELYKGIMDESSRGVFNGKIYVRQEAQKTNAFQSNNNLLLDDAATVNTKPQLEIWADDVKCSHGCTTGQLDEEAVFYLQARGISKDKAKAMLLYAFAQDIIEKVPLENVRSYLEELIQIRLEK